MRQSSPRWLACVVAAALLGGCVGGAGNGGSASSASTDPVTPATTPAASPTPAANPTAAPNPTAAAVREVLDVPYAKALTAQARDLSLDIYVPATAVPWPMVIWGHGGEQSKINGIAFARKMAAQGAIVLVPDLHHTGDPNAEPLGIASRLVLEEADCAVRMARSAAETYGGDPDRLIWSGYSFGGVVGFELALTDPGAEQAWDAYVAKHGGPARQYDCVATEASVPPEALVTSGSARGVDRWPDTYAANPGLRAFVDSINQIGNNPGLKVRMIQGMEDTETLPAVATALADRLKAAGYDVTLTLVPNAGHLPFDDQLVAEIAKLLAS
jgi:dienelactone hydrolase